MRYRIHVAPPRNWVNDPNGPILWNDTYHLYYQHNPEAPRWGDIHWGHAISRDLAHWEDAGIALSPTPGGPDEDGCWSGCARVIDGRPTIFYTGLAIDGDDWNQSVCRAVGDADLAVLTKDPANPIVAASPRPPGQMAHRDPFVFRDHERERWVMLQGTGIADADYTGGAVVLYDSPDADHWTYRGVLCTLPDQVGDIDTGPVWECPALFEADGTWVLLLSVQLPADRGVGQCPYSLWFTGVFDGESFHIEHRGVLDLGDVFYAPALLAHPDGRQLMWGWVQESASQDELDAIGSAGALSLPREVRVVEGAVVTRFARELDVLWHEGTTIDERALAAGEAVILGTPGACWRLRVRDVGPGIGIRLGWDADAEVRLHFGANALELHRGATLVGSVPVSLGDAGVDVIVDETIVELHTPQGALTTRLSSAYRSEVAVFGGEFGGALRDLRLQSAR